MPPKTKYTKEAVTKAAMAIVKRKGLKSLTSRSVAARLGCSTAPVYHHFATMDELALCVMKETQRALLEYSSRPYTDRVFLNMGTGVAMFASEHRQLYRALLLEGDSYSQVIREFLDILGSEMTNDSRFTSLSDGERAVLLNKMWIFTHGLASMICVGLIKDCNQDYIIETLVDVGTDIIGATLARHKGDTKHD
ncbi:MAG: TetR/AcrR family transcriptional regulator [candidate division Zixibacteria bacterium]|nr:TetR/AcrR family transcriptional regulator [candidate division Zixibacteria bacterium]